MPAPSPQFRLNTPSHSPGPGLLGPAQSGKDQPCFGGWRAEGSIYLDLEDENDRASSTIQQIPCRSRRRVVILDRVHRVPELFQQLRGIIDRGRRPRKSKWTLSPARISRHGLAQAIWRKPGGRVSYLELGPFDALEIVPLRPKHSGQGRFRAVSWHSPIDLSLQWRRDFVRTYLERDISQFGSRIPA